LPLAALFDQFYQAGLFELVQVVADLLAR